MFPRLAIRLKPCSCEGSPFPAAWGEALGPAFAGTLFPQPTLSELFSAPPDAGWAGFLLPQINRGRPVLWVQERMAILESGRIHPPGLALADLIHVEARDARAALWAMEEGLRCAALSGVIGELWGDPAALDFTATRRLAVAAERSGVAAFLVRLGGHANLERGADALADRQPAVACPPVRSAGAGSAGLGCRAVPRTRHAPGRWSIAHDPQAERRILSVWWPALAIERWAKSERLRA